MFAAFHPQLRRRLAPFAWAPVWFMVHAAGGHADPWYPAAALTLALAATYGWRAGLLPALLVPLGAVLDGDVGVELVLAVVDGLLSGLGYAVAGTFVGRALGRRPESIPGRPAMVRCVAVVTATVGLLAVAGAAARVGVE
ncbi:MAG: hypothetical protein S0880_31840, partial [Actinomycetota bacterium]|nr:hypothetical protein [Actinomycetota bacterium]